MKKLSSILIAGGMLLAVPAHAARVELRGSPASMVNQNQVAREQGYTFIDSPSEVEKFVAKERLVRVEGNKDLQVSSGVSYPYARPAVKTFLERLSAQYRDACGERLVVTSLTRPRSSQPSNSHDLSVHPTGMAVDLRISTSKACRAWLEGTLLELEDKQLLDVTRERNPPHYHVAVFPEAYASYVSRMESAEVRRSEDSKPVAKAAPVVTAQQSTAAVAEPTKQGSAKGPLVVMVLFAGALFGHARRREGRN